MSIDNERRQDLGRSVIPEAPVTTTRKASPMTTTPPPSVAVMKLSKAGYIELCDRFRDKALTEHQDMRAWMNRALLAESRLATLMDECEPEGTEPTC